MRRGAQAVLCALIASGCHDSLGIVGDAHADAAVDVPGDALVDAVRDAAVDPAIDWITDPDGWCLPRSGEMLVDFALDGDRFSRRDLTLVCTLEGASEVPEVGIFELFLECRSDEGLVEEHRLLFQVLPYLPLDTSLLFDEDLVVTYVADPVFWVNRWVTVTSPVRGLLIASVNAETVAPEGREGWYEPLEAWRVGGVCPVEDVPCGLLEREGVGVGFWDGHASVTVIDGNAKPLEDPESSYMVMVSQAHGYRYVECEDVPLTWVQALVSRLP